MVIDILMYVQISMVYSARDALLISVAFLGAHSIFGGLRIFRSLWAVTVEGTSALAILENNKRGCLFKGM
jgi:uncharacterized membrane protein